MKKNCIFLLIIFLLSTYPGQAMDGWIPTNGFQQVPDFDSGLQIFKHYISTPSSKSWGFHSFSWGAAGGECNLVDTSRLGVSAGIVSLYGKNISTSHMGVVRCIMGDVWGGLGCGQSILWNIPDPLLVSGVPLHLDLEIKQLSSELLGEHWYDSWVMFAINFWFDSVDFPPGGSKTGHKPLVMDLIFYLSHTNYFVSGPYIFKESSSAYHYQALLGGHTIDSGWRLWKINLQDHIERAFSASSIYINDDPNLGSGPLPASNVKLRLYQAEFLIELKAGSGNVLIRNFKLYSPNQTKGLPAGLFLLLD